MTQSVEQWNNVYSNPEQEKSILNSGFIIDPLLRIEVSAESFPQWYQPLQSPIFQIPQTQYLYDNLWFNPIMSVQSDNGNFAYIGSTRFEFEGLSLVSASHAYEGTIGITLQSTSLIDGHFNHTGTIAIKLSAPDTGVVVFNPEIAYSVQGIVIINGTNYSIDLIGEINLKRQDNSASTFRLSITTDSNSLSFLNRHIEISFLLSDENGNMISVNPIFAGVIRSASRVEGIGVIDLSGYDYRGVHNSKGEFVSQSITTVFQGSVSVSSAGTINLAHAPVWNVQLLQDDETITDGIDYFIDTLNGKILIPISSRLLQRPNALTYNYAVPFDTLAKMVDSIANIKGWAIVEDGISFSDYTTPSVQPVVSLSNESVIETIQTFAELSGAKLDCNLFPKIRLYSDVVNITGGSEIVIDETIYDEGSFQIDSTLDGTITEQTVTGTGRPFSIPKILDEAEIADISGSVGIAIVHDQFVFISAQVSTILGLLASLQKKVIAVARFPVSRLFTESIMPSGTLRSVFSSATRSIVASDWVRSLNSDGEVVYELSVMPELLWLTVRAIISYPGAEWGLKLNGQSIEYGNVPEDVVSATGTREIIGIDEALIGDVYENARIETPLHCGSCANAILVEHGNISTASLSLPLHARINSNIGDKINIQKNSIVQFLGNIKEIDYILNTETAEGTMNIVAKGTGTNV